MQIKKKEVNSCNDVKNESHSTATVHWKSCLISKEFQSKELPSTRILPDSQVAMDSTIKIVLFNRCKKGFLQ